MEEKKDMHSTLESRLFESELMSMSYPAESKFTFHESSKYYNIGLHLLGSSLSILYCLFVIDEIIPVSFITMVLLRIMLWRS